MPEIITPVPVHEAAAEQPVEVLVSVSAFVDELKLEWQRTALLSHLAAETIGRYSKQPRQTLEKLLHRALHGRL